MALIPTFGCENGCIIIFFEVINDLVYDSASRILTLYAWGPVFSSQEPNPVSDGALCVIAH